MLSLLTVETVTKCSQIVCGYISDVDGFDRAAFAEFVTDKLARYFASVPSAEADADISALTFSVLSISSPFSLYPSTNRSNAVFFALLSFCGCVVLVGFAACAFNKCSCKDSIYAVDEARWSAVIGYALQFWDFGVSAISVFVYI